MSHFSFAHLPGSNNNGRAALEFASLLRLQNAKISCIRAVRERENEEMIDCVELA